MAESAAIQPIDASTGPHNQSTNQSELSSTNVFAFGLQSSYPAFNHNEQSINQQNNQMNGVGGPSINPSINQVTQPMNGLPADPNFDYGAFYQQFMYPGMNQFPNQNINPPTNQPINPILHGSPYMSPGLPMDFSQLNLGAPLMYQMNGVPVYNQSMNQSTTQSHQQSTNQPANSRPNASVCKYFAAGHCNRGDQCNFAHTNGRYAYPNNQSGNQSMNQSMNQPMNQSMNQSFNRGGRGQRGRGGRSNGRDEPNQNGFHRQQQQYSFTQPINQSIQSMNQPMMNYSDSLVQMNQSINPSMNPLMPLSPAVIGIDAALLAMSPYSQASSIDHAMNYPFPSITLGPTNQSINQSISPSITASNQSLMNSLSAANVSPAIHPILNPPINPLNPSINQSVSPSLEDIRGQVLSLSKDQYGCRFLQRLIDECRPGLLDLIYDEVFSSMIDLMMDPFSNYLCQKLIERVTPNQRLRMIQHISPSIVAISLNLHGTRSIQKLIESQCSSEEIDCLIDCLRPHVVRLISDLNGNHVIQRCLQHFPSSASQFVYDTVCAECVVVCTHKHGCCVMQRCLDYATPQQKQQCVDKIAQHCLTLVQDAYGNYVVQYVLTREQHEQTQPQANNQQQQQQPTVQNQSIINQLVGSINQLACQKFSSNVIEKCFDIGNDRLRARMIEQLISPTPAPVDPSISLPPVKTMRELIADSFANYVIQKALTVAKKPQIDALIDSLRPHLFAVKHTAFGKRITAKIQKKFPNLDVLQWMETGAQQTTAGTQQTNSANDQSTNPVLPGSHQTPANYSQAHQSNLSPNHSTNQSPSHTNGGHNGGYNKQSNGTNGYVNKQQNNASIHSPIHQKTASPLRHNGVDNQVTA